MIVKADNAVRLDHGMASLTFASPRWAGLDAPTASSAWVALVPLFEILAFWGFVSDGPEQVKAWWESLDARTRQKLIDEYPQLISGLVGLPISVRNAINKRQAQNRLAELEAELESLPAGSDRRQHLVELIKSHKRMLQGDVTLLQYDSTGDGRAVAVIGDIENAEHVGVFVPGMNTDMGDVHGQIKQAARLQQRAKDMAAGESVATVMWLGYDTPEGASAGGGKAAGEGKSALLQFVNTEIPAVNRHGEGAHVTVAAHSYGSVSVGLGAQEGLKADDLVLVGSPGVRARRAEQLGDPAHVWVGAAPDDPIPRLPFHGPNPADESFGARRFDTATASGHSDYYGGHKDGRQNESSRNTSRIIAGRYGDVSPFPSTPEPSPSPLPAPTPPL